MADDPNKRFYDELWPHAATLLRTAEVLCRRRGDAEDLVQEALLKAFRSLDSFQRGTNAKAWLMTILRHAHLDRVRQREGKQTISLDSLEGDVPATDAADQFSSSDFDSLLERFEDEQLIAALRDLPPEICWTLLLVEVEGLSHAEASEILGVPVGTVKSRTFRGRTMLRDAISLNAADAP
jgi:RNA polymerase sigma-70 factor (ECF subfamily)